MRRLVDVAEHLDGDLADKETLAGNLRDLRRINRRFGGSRLSIEAIRRVVELTGSKGAAPLRVLDVGTGAADIPLALAAASGPWSRVDVTAVDSRPEVLEAAQRVAPTLRSAAGITLAVTDGLALPWPDRSFDVAHASLVLHHLSRPDAFAFLVELARVSSKGIVINDLERGMRFWLGAWLVLHAMTRNRWTLHDGPLSVRRAWTRHETEALLIEAGLRPVATVVGPAGHRWAIAAVRR